MTIEKLTEEARSILTRNGNRLVLQCIRIIDQQATDNERLRAENIQAEQRAEYWLTQEQKRDAHKKAAEARLADATALLERIRKHTEAHAFTTREWFRSVFANQPPALACVACGLIHGENYPNEPTVAPRADGLARCNDCARSQEDERRGLP